MEEKCHLDKIEYWYGYGNYGRYGNYADSRYSNKDDDSIKK